MFWRRSKEDEVRAERFEDLFRCLDRDGNGVLEPADFTLVAQRLQQHFGWDADDRRAVLVREAWSAFGQRLVRAMDDDVDGTIRRDEFHGWMRTAARDIVKGGHPPEMFADLVRSTFHALDTDSDGYVRPDEYAAYLHGIGSDADPAAAFDKLDIDGDGRLEVDELAWLLTEWISAWDDDAPGTWLLTGRPRTA